MKKFSLIFVFTILSTILFAQSEKFTAAMTPLVQQIGQLDTEEALTEHANKLERIGNAEREEWLPHYYYAYTQIQLALMALQNNQGSKIGAYVDAAQKALDEAKNRTEMNSELETMQGYIYMAKVWENPMINGAKYSPKASASFEKAIAMNEKNPRPYMLKGQNLFYMPAMFGGGKEKAAPFFEKAEAHYAAFSSDDVLAPSWGAGENKYFLSQIK